MFFGLEVKSTQAQAKPVELDKTVKLSQAVLDPSKNGKKEPVCVMVEYEKKQFILCVLDPNIAWQSPLDLVFEGGSQVKFFIKGTGTVHLTGYQTDDDLDDISMSMSDYDDDISDTAAADSDDSEEKVAKKVPTKNTAKVNGRVPVKAREAGKQQVRKVKGGPAVAQPDDEDLDSDSDDEDYDALNQAEDDDTDDDDQDDEESDDDDIDMDEEEVDLDEEQSDDE